MRLSLNWERKSLRGTGEGESIRTERGRQREGDRQRETDRGRQTEVSITIYLAIQVPLASLDPAAHLVSIGTLTWVPNHEIT
ncbi:hypothetical protein K431DRAFT_55923 [Polychaeton citri CBS 116435]|uniref:Uncharacterized protein n=1 Tax=Polychaeton citri CBS 116435 TaxID=1314669 RepID=A0A9P4UUN6_9PEZI|nr:hypothetical protein K431DRAFT_55923 [Polychaeton citri CBS 116435]